MTDEENNEQYKRAFFDIRDRLGEIMNESKYDPIIFATALTELTASYHGNIVVSIYDDYEKIYKYYTDAMNVFQSHLNREIHKQKVKKDEQC